MKLKNLEKELHQFSDKNSSIEAFRPIKLITHNRIDVLYKITYLKLFRNNKKLAEKIYIDHIKVLTLGSYKEKNNPNKNTKEKYLEIFKSLFESIKTKSFQENISLIPLSNTGSILNGSHRLAIAYHLNSEVKAIKLNKRLENYNYEFFIKRGCQINYLELIVQNYLQIKSNVYCLVLWPISNNFDVRKYLKNIIYEKKIKFNFQGLTNFVIDVYENEEWLGDLSNKFLGAYDKSINCYKKNLNTRIFFFHEENQSKVTELKQLIRNKLKIGKHSLHITDNIEETIRLSKTILNNNSIFFLNNSPVCNKFKETKINQILAYQNKNPTNFNENYLIISGSILSLYGLRKSKDIDFIKFEISEDVNNNEKLYSKKIIDLIYNPDSFFYYKGFKFLTIDNLILMKKIRNEFKDRLDLKLIKNINNKNTLFKIINLIQFSRFIFMYLRKNIIFILFKFKLYFPLRYLYRIFK